jgi:hypothetical protein
MAKIVECYLKSGEFSDGRQHGRGMVTRPKDVMEDEEVLVGIWHEGRFVRNIVKFMYQDGSTYEGEQLSLVLVDSEIACNLIPLPLHL